MPRPTLDDPDDFDPYHKWLGIPLNKRPPTYYQILGISPTETDPDTITAAADRHESFVKQFRGGPLAVHVSSILFQVEQARMTLLDSVAREKYDHTLKLAQKRRHKVALEDQMPPVTAAASRSVGEESGLAGQFFRVFAIVGGGMIGMYLLATYVPWRNLKIDADVAQPPPLTNEPATNETGANQQTPVQSGVNPPLANPSNSTPPVEKPRNANAPDTSPTSPIANDSELIAFFNSVVASQRKSGDTFKRVSVLLDNCVHNDGAEIAPLEEAMREASEAVPVADRELDAAAIPEQGVDMRRLVAAMRDWIKTENQVIQDVVPDAIRFSKQRPPSTKERIDELAAIRRKAASIEYAANLALVETEFAFFKNNGIQVPPQVAADLAQAQIAIDSAAAPERSVPQGNPSGASGADPVVIAARLGEIADALAERFAALFNGRDTTGWRTHPKDAGKWRVENGILISPTREAGSLYSVREDFADFHLRVEARVDDKGESGIWFRSPFDPKWPAGNPARTSSFEAKINSTGPSSLKTGSLLVADKAPNPVRQTSIRPGQWFTMEVIAEDNRIVVKVDGRRTASFTDDQRRFRKGCIILQKADDTTLVEFRKIEILEK
jgi:hypothetical protein